MYCMSVELVNLPYANYFLDHGVASPLNCGSTFTFYASGDGE